MLAPPVYRGRRLRPALGYFRMGELVLRMAWRLDAFSAYPFRAWLPGGAADRDNRNTIGTSFPVLSY